ncbi:hypothetical protein ABT337_26310 [Saccharopolyspora hirsuta]|uniref:hypothetical protein n=1 Tax=Saccharopolyspora hirsuta TaxID=1837 RepID=UPI00332B3DF8
MWVALRGDRLLARVAWWSRPGDATPRILDVVDLDNAPPAAPGTSSSSARSR